MWYEIECVGIEKKINQRFRNDYTTAEADVDLEAEEEDDDEAKDGYIFFIPIYCDCFLQYLYIL